MRTFVSLLVLLLLVPLGMSAASGDLLAGENSQLLQNTRADAEHLSRMTSTAMLRRYVRSGYLVPVPANSKTFYLHAINSQYRYCRPWTRLFLQRLGRQYFAQFHEPLRVTSLVRTVGSQMTLARFNENAAEATGNSRSSHLTGATLDISKRWMSPEQQDWMRDTLSSLRDAGYLYAIEEFEQPTFHVMVFRSYQAYGNGASGAKAHARNARLRKVRVPKRHGIKPRVVKTSLATAGLQMPTIKDGQ